MEIRCVYRQHDDDSYPNKVFAGGIQGIEVAYREPYLKPREFEQFHERVRAVLEEHECSISVHAPQIDVNLGSTNWRMRELSTDTLLHSAEWALDLGADILVVHPGMGVAGMAQGAWHRSLESDSRFQESTLELSAQSIERCAREFPTLRLAVENLIFPHEFIRTPDDMGQFLNLVDAPNVGVCLDIGHAVVAGQCWSEFIEMFSSRLFHVHAHDNHGAVDEHLALGQGTIDYKSFFKKLQEVDYNGATTLEFHIDDVDSVNTWFNLN